MTWSATKNNRRVELSRVLINGTGARSEELTAGSGGNLWHRLRRLGIPLKPLQGEPLLSLKALCLQVYLSLSVEWPH